jgi:hypothetical protein
MDTVRYREVTKDGKLVIEEIHKVVVYRFRVVDVEDPDLYAADLIWKWQQNDAGKFVMEHAIDKPEWHQQFYFSSYGYEYVIMVELEKKKLSEFYFRWGRPQ